MRRRRQCGGASGGGGELAAAAAVGGARPGRPQTAGVKVLGIAERGGRPPSRRGSSAECCALARHGEASQRVTPSLKKSVVAAHVTLDGIAELARAVKRAPAPSAVVSHARRGTATDVAAARPVAAQRPALRTSLQSCSGHRARGQGRASRGPRRRREAAAPRRPQPSGRAIPKSRCSQSRLVGRRFRRRRRRPADRARPKLGVSGGTHARCGVAEAAFRAAPPLPS